jgi:predicted small lipoprotein YifL
MSVMVSSPEPANLRSMPQGRRQVLALLLLGALAGCGKKGDLRLPDGNPAARPEAPADEEVE